jgi:hypothetical protein
MKSTGLAIEGLSVLKMTSKAIERHGCGNPPRVEPRNECAHASAEPRAAINNQNCAVQKSRNKRHGPEPVSWAKYLEHPLRRQGARSGGAVHPPAQSQ